MAWLVFQVAGAERAFVALWQTNWSPGFTERTPPTLAISDELLQPTPKMGQITRQYAVIC